MRHINVLYMAGLIGALLGIAGLFLPWGEATVSDDSGAFTKISISGIDVISSIPGWIGSSHVLTAALITLMPLFAALSAIMMVALLRNPEEDKESLNKVSNFLTIGGWVESVGISFSEISMTDLVTASVSADTGIGQLFVLTCMVILCSVGVGIGFHMYKSGYRGA